MAQCTSVSAMPYFYPRPPRGGRRVLHFRVIQTIIISIHALREEGDCCPASGASSRTISIHALREEGDVSLKTTR